MFEKAFWIQPTQKMGRVCPLFKKEFALKDTVQSAVLSITVSGVYEARLNGERVGDYVLAPGWTVYEKRHQYQSYDVTQLLKKGNVLTVILGEGWYRGRLAGWLEINNDKPGLPAELIAQLDIQYADGYAETLVSDLSWLAAESALRENDFYDGELYDATFEDVFVPVSEAPLPKETLIPQEGEKIVEQERIKPLGCFITPKGETVLDFGQNLTGYVEFTVNAAADDRVELSHAEVLDADGNFYTENYRSAKAKLIYICKDGKQEYKPALTFYGFRYVRVDAYPGAVDPEDFTAIAVYSDIKRTGYLSCSNPLLDKLFQNIVWGQKGNFLDVPTDCPQRDERLGWTGDAQVFTRTATYNFDVEKFFIKWLNDLSACQGEDGKVPDVIPDVLYNKWGSAAWGDAACICPWQVYLTYGDKTVLQNQFSSMKLWLQYIESISTTKDLWTGTEHYGDWLGLDAFEGSYKGASRLDFIASAYYAYSTSLVIKAGKVLSQDVSCYETQYANTVEAFQKAFPAYETQTEHAVAIYFDLAKDRQATGDALAEMVRLNGNRLTTGFVGTPYLLHALSGTGHTDVAYDLLLQEEFPSWLYSVKLGATTIWEHWDGVNEKGEFWSSDMNSFNHYAYGAVADWVYGVAAGIQTVESHPGFEKAVIAPAPDPRLEFLCARIETRHGTVESNWRYTGDGKIRYEITTPVDAQVILGEKVYSVSKGTYYF